MTEAFVKTFLDSFDDSRFPGDFLQSYELMECLSDNEMGETLLIKDRQTGEYYVAKCYANKSLLSHTTESELLKKLQHEGLPNFIGKYQNENMLCVVRTYARGKPLDKLAQEAPLTRHQSIAIAVQLCEILTYLHGQIPPIIHRDIKPQNIIVDEQGKITLIDFGISRTYNEASQEDTLCFGTKCYAAPEQYGFSQTDCRTDIFSLGILLCWLLTGKVELQEAKKTLRNNWLTKIITKCTAFAPKDRYQKAAQVKDALTGRTLRRQIWFFLCASILILLGVFLVSKPAGPQIKPPVGITFKEPLIEAGVRLALEMDETKGISEQDLLSINEIFIFGDKAAANAEVFNTYAESFVNNDGTIQRGGINLLDDLTKLKHLRRVSLVYQNITDLTPLSELVNLESIDLRHNPLEDVSPLSQVTSLTSLGLFDTNVSDLTALRNCSRLTTLDIGFTQVKTTAALEGLESLKILVVRKAPLQSLDQIETHPMLEQIYLSETQLLDLSPLLELPRLQFVEVSENMRSAAKAVEKQAQFNIVYD
jgi:serine/threonine protein kinase